jgi:hypothetical protein
MINIIIVKCISGDQVYVGQTGSEFRTRCIERIRGMRHNQEKLRFAQPTMAQ